MRSITLSYDENNALARRRLAELIETGLFEQAAAQDSIKSEEEAAHRKKVEEFLYGSTIMAAKAFANKI